VGVMIIPVYIAVEILGAGIYMVWILATVYICGLGVAFLLRYRHGNWKRMRVIEPGAERLGSQVPGPA